jgi:anti-sigma-K factor RskA
MTLDTCEHIEELLALASVDALEPRDVDVDISAHLATCASCRRAAAAYTAAVSTLPDSLAELEPRARLRRALMARVYGEAAATAPARRVPLLRRLWQRLPAGRGFTVAAGLAAAAAVVLGIWGGTRPTATASPIATIAVTGTTSEPSANGTISYNPQTERAVLTVQGLPGPDAAGTPGQHVYEVWLIPSSGAAVPAAFLTLQPDGRTWTAVMSGDMSRYRTVAATIEPAGGSPAPTGAEVLTASLS